jgi:hypothetical protein
VSNPNDARCYPATSSHVLQAGAEGRFSGRRNPLSLFFAVVAEFTASMLSFLAEILGSRKLDEENNSGKPRCFFRCSRCSSAKQRDREAGAAAKNASLRRSTIRITLAISRKGIFVN